MEQLVSLYERWLHVPRWQKWIVIVLLGVVLAALLYYFQVAPLKEELSRKQREIESLTLTVNRLRVVEKRKSLLLKELEELRKQIKQIESRLPTGKEEVSQILRSITGADSGMSIKLIKREDVKRHKYYVEYPYRVVLLGTYPSFIRWCEKLSKANRIINFGDMRIEALQPVGEKKRGRSKQKEEVPRGASVKAELEIKAFTLTE